ncbi:hypothetical protein SO078_21155 (plasmid) [Sinorhizobium meliloti]|uniref:hypothetical protein n=1 Tax=Rhizobium meliloti TaxID=382 RepID=UPI002D77057C|nr:hypothetical protein [Sinorhizobium meliloti]WRQ69418.1 hypothetical protein SO078_21155 [Sinorhizobium meliloti]
MPKLQLSAVPSNRPALDMLQLFDIYVDLSGDKFLGLDKRARDKKVNRYKAAATDFVAIMGEIDVVQMVPKQAFEFAANLTNRVANEEIELETAQKKLQFINMFVRKVFRSHYPTKTNQSKMRRLKAMVLSRPVSAARSPKLKSSRSMTSWQSRTPMTSWSRSLRFPNAPGQA